MKPPSPVIEEVEEEPQPELEPESYRATPPLDTQVEVIVKEPTEITEGESEKSEIEPTKEVRYEPLGCSVKMCIVLSMYARKEFIYFIIIL